MINFKLIGIKLGEGLKYDTSINEINRIATAIFDFPISSHPHGSITSSRSQLIFDWVMTLAERHIADERKFQLLQEFINVLTPENSPLRNLIKETTGIYKFDFWSIIHKDIVSAAKNKFEDGYYADAVESTLKEINIRVKKIVQDKIGQEFDGASLMNRAFSLEHPIIILDDLSSETGKNIQKGYMQIFAGAMTGIRNPKAHENIVIDKERAMHFLFLTSLLMQILDESNY
ncbi:MAG: TIGR02391 family protein [candidate division Zixibacteria bacterium]|nr:TIGR02391 family protein [candidate division Zixibacteria bacterium]